MNLYGAFLDVVDPLPFLITNLQLIIYYNIMTTQSLIILLAISMLIRFADFDKMDGKRLLPLCCYTAAMHKVPWAMGHDHGSVTKRYKLQIVPAQLPLLVLHLATTHFFPFTR